MKGKKILSLVMLLSLITLLFTGCGGDKKEAATSENAKEKDKVFVLKWAHSSPTEKDRLPDASMQIIKEIEQESNGRLKFEHYPASQLGAEREQLEGVSLGTIDLAVLSTGPVAGLFPEIAVTAVPYLFANREAAWKVYDGEFGKTLAKKMEDKTGIKVLGWAENGLRTFSNSKRAVSSPADMKGLKIRTMENKVHMEIVNSLGASAVPITFAELYTALSQKTVDGQENGISLTYTNKLYEQLKYITLDYHVYDPYGVFMAKDSFNKLPADLQELLVKKIGEFVTLERKLNKEYDEKCLKAMADSGIKVTELTAEQLQAFKDATAKVIDTIKKDAGEDLVKLMLSEAEKVK